MQRFLRHPALILVPTAVVVFLLIDSKNGVAYVEAIAWPAVVFFALLAFGGELRDLVGRILHAKAFGTEFDFARQNEKLIEGVRDIDHDLPKSPEIQDEAASDDKPLSSPSGAMPKSGNVEPELQVAHQRRAIERAINLGAEWGFRARDQVAHLPTLEIHWHGDEPRIIGAWGLGRSDSDSRRKQAEDEVRRLQHELHRAKMSLVLNPVERGVAEEMLKDAKRRLASVDPHSHLLM